MALVDWRVVTDDGLVLPLIDVPDVRGPVSYGLGVPTAGLLVDNTGGRMWNPKGTGLMQMRRLVRVWHRDALVFKGHVWETTGSVIAGSGAVAYAPARVVLKAMPGILMKRQTDADRFTNDSDAAIIRHLLGTNVLQRERFDETGNLRTLTAATLEEGELVLEKDPDTNLYPATGEAVSKNVFLRGPENEPSQVRLDVLYEAAGETFEYETTFATSSDVDAVSTGVVDTDLQRARAGDRIETITESFVDEEGTATLDNALIAGGQLERDANLLAEDDFSVSVPAAWVAEDATWDARSHVGGAMLVSQGCVRRYLGEDVERGSVEVNVPEVQEDAVLAFYDTNDDLDFLVQLAFVSSTSVDVYAVVPNLPSSDSSSPSILSVGIWTRQYVGRVTLPHRFTIRWSSSERALIVDGMTTGGRVRAIRGVRIGALGGTLATSSAVNMWQFLGVLPAGGVTSRGAGQIRTENDDRGRTYTEEGSVLAPALGGRIWYRRHEWPNAERQVEDPADDFFEDTSDTSYEVELRADAGATKLRERLQGAGTAPPAYPGYLWNGLVETTTTGRFEPVDGDLPPTRSSSGIAGAPANDLLHLEAEGEATPAIEQLFRIAASAGTSLAGSAWGVYKDFYPGVGDSSIVLWQKGQAAENSLRLQKSGNTVALGRFEDGFWRATIASVDMTSANPGEATRWQAMVRRTSEGHYHLQVVANGVRKEAWNTSRTTDVMPSVAEDTTLFGPLVGVHDSVTATLKVRDVRFWAGVAPAELAIVDIPASFPPGTPYGGETSMWTFSQAYTTARGYRTKTARVSAGASETVTSYGNADVKENVGSVVFALAATQTSVEATVARDAGVTKTSAVTVGTYLGGPRILLGQTVGGYVMDEPREREVRVGAGGLLSPWWRSRVKIDDFEAYHGHARPETAWAWTSITRAAQHEVRRARLTLTETGLSGTATLAANLVIVPTIGGAAQTVPLTDGAWVDLTAAQRGSTYYLQILGDSADGDPAASVQAAVLELAAGYSAASTTVQSTKLNGTTALMPELFTVRPKLVIPNGAAATVSVTLNGGLVWRAVSARGESFTPTGGELPLTAGDLDVRWRVEGTNTDTSTTWELTELAIIVEEEGGSGSVEAYISTDDGATWTLVTPGTTSVLAAANRGRKLAWKLVLATTQAGATPRVDQVSLEWDCAGYTSVRPGEVNTKVPALSMDFLHIPVMNALQAVVDATKARVRWRLDATTETYYLDYNYDAPTWVVELDRPTQVETTVTDTKRDRVKVVG